MSKSSIYSVVSWPDEDGPAVMAVELFQNKPSAEKYAAALREKHDCCQVFVNLSPYGVESSADRALKESSEN